jgi:curved DNA-binding protein CbpA
MTPQNGLEINGSLVLHPFSEVAAEIMAAHLSGSLRLEDGGKKAVVYFKNGLLVFAASNLKEHKIASLLISRGRIDRTELRDFPNVGNDFELSSHFVRKGILSKEDVESLFREQITGIVSDVLTWTEGEWVFSPLARVRDGLNYDIQFRKILANYSRSLPEVFVSGRFKSTDERFMRSDLNDLDIELTPEEAFVLSRSADGPITVKNILQVAPMAESRALHLMYTLWITGFLSRADRQRLMDESTVKKFKNVRLELKREAKIVSTPVSIAEKPANTPVVSSAADAAEPTITLDQYLDRVESAATYYDVLGVDKDVDNDELKRVYFSLAKQFHPDKFRSVDADKFRRIQDAFTSLSQAHETLKTAELREIYDYRVGKQLAEHKKSESKAGNASLQAEQAAESFDRGYSLLLNGDPHAAVPFLARAAHYAPKNAKYRAYYGQALAQDHKQRHKAEAEMQAAVKIDGSNPSFRLMLAEFYAEIGLIKRAEGELKRLLALFPNDSAAKNMLADLRSRAS